MADRSIEEIGRKMDALNVWDVAARCNWVVRPRGSAFPYFCTSFPPLKPFTKGVFLMIEGWENFHTFVRTRIDHDFGYLLTPMDLPHFELVIDRKGGVLLMRDDPGYVPRAVTEDERRLCAKILWEAFGVMLRLESEKSLPFRFAERKAMFARVEAADGTWSDEAIEIPDPRPYVESVRLLKADVARAKDLPFDSASVCRVDFAVLLHCGTKEPRPRSIYQLTITDVKTNTVLLNERLSIDAETGLKGLWESLPSRLLSFFVRSGRVPGEIVVTARRLFRLLRPMCMSLPFKLSYSSNPAKA